MDQQWLDPEQITVLHGERGEGKFLSNIYLDLVARSNDEIGESHE